MIWGRKRENSMICFFSELLQHIFFVLNKSTLLGWLNDLVSQWHVTWKNDMKKDRMTKSTYYWNCWEYLRFVYILYVMYCCTFEDPIHLWIPSLLYEFSYYTQNFSFSSLYNRLWWKGKIEQEWKWNWVPRATRLEKKMWEKFSASWIKLMEQGGLKTVIGEPIKYMTYVKRVECIYLQKLLLSYL